jgi:hypothetical protein
MRAPTTTVRIAASSASIDMGFPPAVPRSIQPLLRRERRSSRCFCIEPRPCPPHRRAVRVFDLEPLRHLGLADADCLADIETLELRVPEIERLVVPGALMRSPERLRLGPGFEGGAILPHRVGRTKRVILGFVAFKQVELDEARDLVEMAIQTCSKAASDPLATRNRFMATNIGWSPLA